MSFLKKKMTVDGITKSLTKIKNDLEALEAEKVEELNQFEAQKRELDFKISEASNEKERGWKIFNNISNLLGEPVTE